MATINTEITEPTDLFWVSTSVSSVVSVFNVDVASGFSRTQGAV